MPVEDLDFLYKNSVKENLIVLIDSQKRDQYRWNEPNDFQINFTEPFKFIYGIDVLDVTIPRTMYSIETHNNNVTFKVGHGKLTDTSQYVSLSIDERDYTISEYIDELNLMLNDYNLTAEVPITKVSENRKSVLMFTNTENPPKPFVFNMKTSSMADNLGFNQVSSSKYNNMYQSIDYDLNLYASVPTDKIKYSIDFLYDEFTTEINTFMQILFHNDDKPIDDELEEIENAQIFSDVSAVLEDVGQFVSFFINGITIVNNKESLRDQPFSIYEIDLSDVKTKNERDTILELFVQTLKISANEDNMFNLHTLDTLKQYNITLLTSQNDIYKFDEHNSFTVDETKSDYTFKLIPIKNKGNVLHYIYSPKLHTVNIKYDLTFISSFQLTSTGVLKLYGERYVTIHCDNIENHLRGSMMFNDYSPGLALVNLGVQGYSQSRNDFYGVVYKEFHPIGKLNHLRFTVRRSDGLLYDFKNVNWHMLISVKYYVMKNVRKFSTSILNPNYNINFLEYQTNSQRIKDRLGNSSDNSDEYDSDDESDHDIDDVEFRDTYLTPERYLKEKMESYNSETDANSDTDSDE
uniref:DUF5901 domain-containing protein n=1 Tax=viral metagenome TaxID=1070528 RepID=A0A6C0BQ55_9ZZZZ